MSLWNIYKAKKLGIGADISFDALVGRKLKDISEYITDTVPYLFRMGLSSASIGTECIDQIVGGSIVWNQLVQTSDTSVTVPSGHKYLSKINNVQTIGVSDGTAISINDGTKDNVHDLTMMFGAAIADYVYSLEQNTAGNGVKWFRNLFGKGFYAYASGSLLSVGGLISHVTTGKNYAENNANTSRVEGISISRNTDGSIVVNGTISSNSIAIYNLATDSSSAIQNDLVKRIPNGSYKVDQVCSNTGVRLQVRGSNDTSGKDTGSVSLFSANSGSFSVDDTYAYNWVRLYLTAGTYSDVVIYPMIRLADAPTGYEKYIKNSYALEDTLALRGILRLDENNKLYYDGDTYDSDGTVTRKFGVRAYQEGDVTDGETMITDGTNTIYRLSARTTETADPFTNPQVCDKWGTEAYVVTEQSGVAMPVGHRTKYKKA